MSDADIFADANHRALHYLNTLEQRRVFPDQNALDALFTLRESMPAKGTDEASIIEVLDRVGTPATVCSSGPNYYGFVIGSTLPIADAAERIALAWDQCASGEVNSPIAHALEGLAAQWITDLFDFPRESVVGFGTSATACGLSSLACARNAILQACDWDMEENGLIGAPEIRVVVSEKVHVTLIKALRILGFGRKQILFAPCDKHGRIDPKQLPKIDDRTIVCLQAGEVNTGEFDPFALIIPQAKECGAWVHVDGAFGLWARVSKKHHHLTQGVELADSWTTDGHKWLNTPYDGAMAICRHPKLVAKTLNADAAYATSGATAQKNLTLEFSRRARGIPIWAALKYLGREGIAAMVDGHCTLAQKISTGLQRSGYHVLNRVVLNQILVRCSEDDKTVHVMKAAQQSGEVWFGPSVWENRPAFRISVSSWRTEEKHVDKLITLMDVLAKEVGL